MRMFASDLDRTLIYSNKALADFGQSGEDLIGVERKDGREIAFMTQEARSLLKEISAQMLFVPVTTRTYEQYKRIFIFRMSLTFLTLSHPMVPISIIMENLLRSGPS